MITARCGRLVCVLHVNMDGCVSCLRVFSISGDASVSRVLVGCGGTLVTMLKRLKHHLG
jgi:hypothetical protein